MKHCCSLLPVRLILLLIICSDLVPLSTCVSLKKLFKPENEELLNIMKEELDQFKIDMTKSFMRSHSRRKRAQDGHVNDIEINTETPFPEIAVNSVGPFSTFTFAGKPYLIKRDGIYQLNDLTTNTEEGKVLSQDDILRDKKGSWILGENEIVLNGFEWKRNFLIVTTTGDFSTIYTLHENSLKPVFRQNIQNKAKAVGAEFFDYRLNLYMVILNDNEMHTTTFSPVFLWAESYMDEIHLVQTTGASAVKTFTINSKAYIAIAQTRDSAGNTQVGTMVLSMDHMDRLERVQLLWSNSANALHYMRTEKEHFLVIGQEKEPSIAYWFGGMDFIFWQQFDDLQGKDIAMEGLQLTPDEPILLTSDGGSLKSFSRSVSATKIMTTWVKSKSLDAFDVHSNMARAGGARNNVKITQVKILQIGEDKKNVMLAVTRKQPGSNVDSIRMYPVKFVERQISVSRTKEPGDSLSQCLQTLRTSLKNSEGSLNRIDQASKMVLTTDGDWDFKGEIETRKVIKPASSQVKSAEVMPINARAGSSEKLENSPSKLMENMKQSNAKLEAMKSQLQDIFYKSKDSNVVTGNLKFHNVEFSQLNAMDSTDLKFETINGVSWENLDNFALKTSFSEAQQIIADWEVESIQTDTFDTVKKDSKLSANNFMTKSCAKSQTVSGIHQFNKEMKISEEVKLEPETSINGIQFSDIVMKRDTAREIKGIKHAPFVKGDYQAHLVNDVNLKEWFASVARLSGTTEQQFVGPIKIQKNVDLQIQNLRVDEMNGKNWNEFAETVMLDGVNQEVKGLFNVEALKTDNLRAKSISGIKSDELITSRENQRITSHFTAENVEIQGPLTTRMINGIQLSDAVNRNNGRVEINGPVMLESFQVQDILVPEGVTIADKDVSELVNLKKVHKYSTVDNRPILFKQVNVDRLITEHIDNENVDDFLTKYWSNSRGNVANPAQLVLDNRKTIISQGNFKTGKLNHFDFPNEFISLDNDLITLRAPLQFKHPVKVAKNVTMDKGAKIQGIDMSEAQSMIVDDTFTGVIRGVKTFALPVQASHGAQIDMLNGMDPRNDVVMLNSDEPQRIEGLLKFEKNVIVDHFTVNNGDVHVDGLVNEVNLADIKHTTAYKDTVNKINGELIFERGINVKQFSTVLMNDINIGEITDNMIFLDSPDMQTIDGHITLENGRAEFLTDSIVGNINNVPVAEYLSQVVRLDSTEQAVINGRKTFLDAHLNDKLMCNSFNNVDLKDLETNAFSRSKVQMISGKWSFQDAHFTDNLHTTDIEGISLENIIFTDEQVDILSPVAFTSRQTSIEGPVSVLGSVNGIQFHENMKDAINIDGIQNFDQIIVDGNLDWSNNRPELEGLSYLFENAVTKSGPQSITGSVTFSKGFHSSEINAPNKWLGDVDLKRIQEDALMKNADNMVISGSNAFTKPISIQNLVNPVKSLDTERVNDINLRSMSDDIVQMGDVSNEKVISGRKRLHSDMRVKSLNVKDKISDVSVNDLCLANSEVEIDQVHFSNVNIDEDIEPESTEGLDLKSLLENRVSLKNPNQVLNGDYSFQQVSVESTNDCKLSTVNDVTVSNVLKKSKIENLRTISGKKTFKNFAIEGNLETKSLNNHPIKDILDSTLRVNRVEKITRPVIFESPVIVNQQLEVESINDIHLERFSSQVSERISRLVSDAENPETLANELNVQASKLRHMTQERPVWLEYLRMKQDLTGLGLGAQSRVDHVQMTTSRDILVTLHRDTDGQEKGLPKGCNCNSISTVNLAEFAIGKKREVSQVKTIGTDNCFNVFNVVSPNKRSYMVLGGTISSNKTCVTEEDKNTIIRLGEHVLMDATMGHISDVSVFSEKETDFLVLSQYFDKNTQSHSAVTRVISVDSARNVENVQSIDTHGARKIALSKINDNWMLAIANSKSSTDESSCNADSAIYAWSSENNQFLLMRTIMTDGAFDVEFIVTETSNEFYKQSFVAFAQEGNSASGEVMIFRYEQPGGNFVMSQTIRSNWPVTGLRTTCVCQTCFLVTTVPQEGIVFYENRFVEGFQEYYKAPVFGATDISGFKLDEKYLFAIATNKGPIIAEAVVAGSCPN